MAVSFTAMSDRIASLETGAAEPSRRSPQLSVGSPRSQGSLRGFRPIQNEAPRSPRELPHETAWVTSASPRSPPLVRSPTALTRPLSIASSMVSAGANAMAYYSGTPPPPPPFPPPLATVAPRGAMAWAGAAQWQCEDQSEASSSSSNSRRTRSTVQGYSREVICDRIKGKRVSIRRMRQLAAWLDSLKLWPTTVRPHSMFADLRNGLLLCRLLEAVAGAKFAALNERPRSQVACIANIEAALAFIWTKGVRVNGARIPPAAAVYDGANNKLKVLVLLDEILDVFVLRQVRKEAPTVLHWFKSILSQYPGQELPEKVLCPPFPGLWGCFQSATRLFCVVSHYFGRAPITPAMPGLINPSAIQESGNWADGCLSGAESGRDATSDGYGRNGCSNPSRNGFVTRDEEIVTVADSAAVFARPLDLAEYRANVSEVFSLLRAAGVPVLLETQDWLTCPDPAFVLLQLSLVHRRFSRAVFVSTPCDVSFTQRIDSETQPSPSEERSDSFRKGGEVCSAGERGAACDGVCENVQALGTVQAPAAAAAGDAEIAGQGIERSNFAESAESASSSAEAAPAAAVEAPQATAADAEPQVSVSGTGKSPLLTANGEEHTVLSPRQNLTSTSEGSTETERRKAADTASLLDGCANATKAAATAAAAAAAAVPAGAVCIDVVPGISVGAAGEPFMAGLRFADDGRQPDVKSMRVVRLGDGQGMSLWMPPLAKLRHTNNAAAATTACDSSFAVPQGRLAGLTFLQRGSALSPGRNASGSRPVQLSPRADTARQLRRAIADVSRRAEELKARVAALEASRPNISPANYAVAAAAAAAEGRALQAERSALEEASQRVGGTYFAEPGSPRSRVPLSSLSPRARSSATLGATNGASSSSSKHVAETAVESETLSPEVSTGGKSLIATARGEASAAVSSGAAAAAFGVSDGEEWLDVFVKPSSDFIGGAGHQERNDWRSAAVVPLLHPPPAFTRTHPPSSAAAANGNGAVTVTFDRENASVPSTAKAAASAGLSAASSSGKGGARDVFALAASGANASEMPATSDAVVGDDADEDGMVRIGLEALGMHRGESFSSASLGSNAVLADGDAGDERASSDEQGAGEGEEAAELEAAEVGIERQANASSDAQRASQSGGAATRHDDGAVDGAAAALATERQNFGANSTSGEEGNGVADAADLKRADELKLEEQPQKSQTLGALPAQTAMEPAAPALNGNATADVQRKRPHKRGVTLPNMWGGQKSGGGAMVTTRIYEVTRLAAEDRRSAKLMQAMGRS